MSKSTISFLSFIVLVLVIFVSSSVFANLGKKDMQSVGGNLPVVSSSTSTGVNANVNTNTPTPAVVPADNTSAANTVPSSGITMYDVQKHNNQSSCWTVVNGGVYDLTSFVTPHQGGSKAILRLCGVDGTSAFTNQHGSQRRPNNELVGLKIGDLSK